MCYWALAMGCSCLAVDTTFFLLNPSTRECKELPRLPFLLNPRRQFYLCLYGLGYDSSTDDYKVVILSYCYYDESGSGSQSETESYTTVSVYSLKTNAWRRIQDTKYRIDERNVTVGVYFNGCRHWVFWRDSSCLIGAFNLADEVFREVSLPASWVNDEIRKYGNGLAVVGGCLCSVYILSGSRQIEVWTMKVYGVRASWTKVCERIMIDILDLFGLLAQNEFVFTAKVPGVTEDKLVVYNHQTGRLMDIMVRGIPTKFIFLGTYVESLLPCLS